MAWFDGWSIFRLRSCTAYSTRKSKPRKPSRSPGSEGRGGGGVKYHGRMTMNISSEYHRFLDRQCALPALIR